MDETDRRNVPYTSQEKIFLANLIDNHKIIEDKRTDGSATEKKKQEWEQITNQYNSQADIIVTKRRTKQLIKLWNNLKQRKRKATTELKHQRLVTGGGSEPEDEGDPIMEAVASAAPFVDVSFPNRWDSTAVLERERKLLVPEEASSSPSSPKAKKKSETPKATKIKCEADSRIKRVEDQQKRDEELHTIKVKIEEAQLKAAIALQQKAEYEAEKARLEMEIFKKNNSV